MAGAATVEELSPPGAAEEQLVNGAALKACCAKEPIHMSMQMDSRVEEAFSKCLSSQLNALYDTLLSEHTKALQVQRPRGEQPVDKVVPHADGQFGAVQPVDKGDSHFRVFRKLSQAPGDVKDALPDLVVMDDLKNEALGNEEVLDEPWKSMEDGGSFAKCKTDGENEDGEEVDEDCESSEEHAWHPSGARKSVLELAEQDLLSSAELRWSVLVCGIWEDVGDRMPRRLTTRGKNEEGADVTWGLHPVWSMRGDSSAVTCAHNRAKALAHINFAETVWCRWKVVVDTRHGDMLKENSFMQKFVVHPDGFTRVWWSTIGIGLIFWDLCTSPMEAVGFIGSPLLAFSYAALMYWTFDLGMQCLTGFHNNGVVDLRPRATLKRYAKTWMGVDMAIVLIDLLFVISDVDTAMRGGRTSFKGLRGLRLIRLVRLGRVHKALEVWRSIENRIFSEYLALLVAIVKLLLLLVLISHYIGCAFYGLTLLTDSSITWVEEYEPRDKAHTYLMSLHWAVTQFTPATNNISPQNPQERVFAIVIVILGLVAFSSFVSSVTNSVNQLRMLGLHEVHERAKIREFITRRNISTELGHRIMRFFVDVKCQSRRALMEEDVQALRELPESLKVRLNQETFMPVFNSHMLFEQMAPLDPPVLVQICHQAVKVEFFLLCQDIFLDGTESNHVWSVLRGSLHYCAAGIKTFSPGKMTHRRPIVHELQAKAWISEASFWVRWIHVGQLSANSNCELALVDCDRFREIVSTQRGIVYETLRRYALFFVIHAQESAQARVPITDLPLDESVQDRLLTRARSLQHLGVKGGSKYGSFGSRDLAMQLLDVCSGHPRQMQLPSDG